MVGNFGLPPAVSQDCCVTLDSALHVSEPHLLLCEVNEEGKSVLGGQEHLAWSPTLASVSLFKSNFVLKGRKQASPLLSYFMVG